MSKKKKDKVAGENEMENNKVDFASLSIEDFDYMTFLNGLIAAGDRLPKAWPYIQGGVQDLRDGTSKLVKAKIIITGEEVEAVLLMAPAPDINESIANVEQNVVALLRADENGSGMKAIGDGQLIAALRNAWQFIQANPQLIQFIISLFGSLPKPVTPTQLT